MKRSIVKLVLSIITVVILSMTGIFVWCSYKQAGQDAYEYARFETYSAAKTLSMSYSGCTQEDILSNGTYAAEINADMQELIDEGDLIFVYIVVPDYTESSVRYYYLKGTEGTEDTVSELLSNVDTKRDDIPDEVFRVMRNESMREDIELNNRFGHVLSSFVPLVDDNNEVIAVIGADISITTIKTKLMNKLPGRFFIICVVGVLGIITLFIALKHKLIKPLQLMSTAMKEFGQNGNYEVPPLNIQNDNEIGLMYGTFNQMAELIRSNIADIKEYSLKQSRVEAELKTASKIQQGFLPPTHYANEEFEINACMLPAKEVGGDFYDYFEENGQMVLLIADVSGNGLSAAMFMANAISLVRAYVKKNLEPHEVLSAVNRELERSNPNMRFITLFLAYVNTEKALIRYSNAGHNAPYILVDGRIKVLDGAGSLPLGMFEEESYETCEQFFPIGSTLFLYTDGVNEAVNKNHEMFGLKRLEEVLRRSSGIDALSLVRKELEEYTLNCEQSDDITMLTFTSNCDELLIPAEKNSFENLRDWILNDNSVPDSLKMKLCLVAEEAFINIASYAYVASKGTVKIRKKFSDTVCILQMEDTGKPFDQTQNVINIEEYDPFKQSGGLGRLMIKSLSDESRYANIEGCNILLLLLRCIE